MSEKNYYLDYIIVRKDLSHVFGASNFNPVIHEMIAEAEKIYAETGAEKTYDMSHDGKVLTITVKFKTLESRDAVVKLWHDNVAKQKEFVDDHDHLEFDVKIYETDA